MLLFKNQQKPKNTLKIQKKPKKNISFLKSISTLKFLTIKFLRCNIYQLSNDNINYVPKANLPKQNHSSWLFVQKNSKNQKKVKTQNHKNNSRIAIRLLSHHQTHFSNEQNCLLHSSNFYFFVNIYSTFSQWCIIFLISMLQKSKLISNVSKFGSMLRITPTFLARMLRV